MKRILSLSLIFVLLLSLLAACTTTPAEETTAPTETETSEDPTETPTEEPIEKISVNIGALNGPTGVGMVQLMDQAAAGTAQEDWQFTLSSDPSEMMAKIISGDLDIAAVPTNVASVMYNKTEGDVQLLALNTLGVLYLLQRTGTEGTPITSLEELAGKTIYLTGQGANPEYVLSYLLQQSGLEPGKDVNLEFFATNDELTAKMLADSSIEFVMMAEPSVTSALSQMEDFTRVLDVNELWDNTVTDDSSLTMGCVVVRKDFAQEHPEAVDAFLEEYSASIEFVNSDLDAASELIETYGIVPKAALAKAALPNCNIVFIAGSDMQAHLEGYLNVLYAADPTSVGGSVPGADFYYVS